MVTCDQVNAVTEKIFQNEKIAKFKTYIQHLSDNHKIIVSQFNCGCMPSTLNIKFIQTTLFQLKCM